MRTKVIFGVGLALCFLSFAVAGEATGPYTPDLAAMHLHIVRKHVAAQETPISTVGERISRPAPPYLVSALETFMKRKQCDNLMDHCYRDCKAEGAGPAHCNQTCTTDKQCGWSLSQTYGDYLEQEIEALAVTSIRLARAN